MSVADQLWRRSVAMFPVTSTWKMRLASIALFSAFLTAFIIGRERSKLNAVIKDNVFGMSYFVSPPDGIDNGIFLWVINRLGFWDYFFTLDHVGLMSGANPEAAIDALARLRSVRFLEECDGELSKSSLLRLGDCTSLEYLDTWTKLDHEVVSRIATLPNLVYLGIHDQPIDATMIRDLSSMAELRMLNLSSCVVSRDVLRELTDELPDCVIMTSLGWLDLNQECEVFLSSRRTLIEALKTDERFLELAREIELRSRKSLSQEITNEEATDDEDPFESDRIPQPCPL